MSDSELLKLIYATLSDEEIKATTYEKDTYDVDFPTHTIRMFVDRVLQHGESV